MCVLWTKGKMFQHGEVEGEAGEGELPCWLLTTETPVDWFTSTLCTQLLRVEQRVGADIRAPRTLFRPSWYIYWPIHPLYRLP